jgi:hypothetical protein
MVQQYIIVVTCDKGSCSPHDSSEEKRERERERESDRVRERRNQGLNIPFMGVTPKTNLTYTP